MSTTTPALVQEDVAAHAEGLRALARHLVRDGAAAEDAAQEAWLVALRGGPADGVPFRWWMRGVVRNVTRHMRRDAATRQRHERVVPPPRGEETPDALVERTELHHRLVGAVLALDEPYRTAVVMRYFEDLSAAEIARRTGVPGGTVRSRLKRGLDMLRARLDGEHGGDRRAWAVFLVPFAWGGKPRSAGPATLLAAAACLLVAVAAIVAFPARQHDRAGAATSAPHVDTARDGRAGGRPAGSRPVRARAESAAATGAPAPADADSAARAAAATEQATGLSLEVVDEHGAPVRAGTVKLEIADILQLAGFPEDALSSAVLHLGEKELATNPLVVRDLPRELDGLDVVAFARVDGFPPTAAEKVTIRSGSIPTIRLVVTRPQEAAVVVVDDTTDAPVAGAAVVSVTELERRRVKPAAVRGTVADGSAVAGDDGRCRLGGLGRGEHEVAADAQGFLRWSGRWTDGELRVRMTPQKASGTVTVTFTGPDGRPVPGIAVQLYGTDRRGTTDADGRAVFDAVAAGHCSVHLDIPAWVAARKERGWAYERETMFAATQVEAGGQHAIALGYLTGTAVVEGRVVGPDGAGIEGVTVKLSGPHDADATSDAAGAVRIADLPAGTYYAAAAVGPRAQWVLGEVVVGSSALHPEWKLGYGKIRGRVVAGPERRGVPRVRVWCSGARTGCVTTDADGRFELTGAAAGTWLVYVDAGELGARQPRVAVPSAEDVVLELVETGRVSVRFAAADAAELRRARYGLRVAGEKDVSWVLGPGAGADDLVSTGVVPGQYEVVLIRDVGDRVFPVEVRSGATSVVEVASR